MTKTRLPPTWLVLVPALALAAVGARAVMAEMRASQDAARDRARSVASRLARSVDALVAEYAAPLPVEDRKLTDRQIVELMAHLDPAIGFYVRRTIRLDGVASDLTPARGPLPPTGDDDLVRDAVARARKIAAEPGGESAAAALLAATAVVVERRLLAWPLRLEQARCEMRAGDRTRALAALADVSEETELFEFDGTNYPDAALETAADLLGPVAPPTWWTTNFVRLLQSPSLVGDDVLDRIERPIGPALPARLRFLRRMNASARRLAAASENPPIAATLLTTQRDGPELTLWRSYEYHMPALYGGAVPASVVKDRLVGEARALAAEAGVVTVRLATSAGEHALDTPGAATRATDVIVESVPLASPSLAMWRAEAVVVPETGVPATAWLLAAAVVATTAALLVGTIALRRAAERSARLAEERRTFLDHVAHELRTPSAAVLALTEQLASGHVTPERELVYRTHLLRELRRLAGLVDDTLDFARLDAGRLAFKMEPADLRDVVRQAIEESDGAGRVVAKFPDAPVVRDVDAAALRRAVKNLVENAVRHGGGDGPVDVALEASTGMASIVVADHGRGIAAEHLPRIFERFYRVPSATHETKGVGLGLALCREIARAHGGDVTVASEVGKGSTFTLTAPIA